MVSQDPIGEHLSTEQVAAYLDRELSGAERLRMESHLATCDECTAELAEVASILRAPARRLRWQAAAGLAAAAAVAAVLLVTSLNHETPPTGPVLRDGGRLQEERGTPSLGVVAPAEGGVVSAHDAAFTWRSAGAGAFYRITVTEANGDVLWSGSTSDTTAALPPQVGLGAASDYFWYVDALLPDGTSVTTGIHRFRTGS